MSEIFGTDGVRGLANISPMTVEMSLQLGRAMAYKLTQNSKKRKKVIIGKDTRLSCYMFEQAISAGICSMGVDTYLVGPIPTPGISFLTRSMRADGGVVISASHNPFEDNGIKFFSKDGLKLPDKVEKDIEELLFSNELNFHRPTAKDVGKTYRIDDAQGRYIEFCKNTFPKGLTLDNLKIVVDCANGASYKIAPKIFEELGAKIIPIGISPDGTNINKGCGSTYTDLLAQKVIEHSADLGFAFDGDADRVIFVDNKGEVVDGDKIKAICANELIKTNSLSKNTVVGTVMSNLGLEVALSNIGVKLIRTQVGDRYIIEEMLANGYNLGGEQSGHIIFMDYNVTGDGVIAALQILSIIMRRGKSLKELATIMEKYPQVLLNIKVKEKKPISEVPALFNSIKDVEEKLGNKGRLLVRYSGTEAKLRIMLEGEDKALITKYSEEIAGIAHKTLC